MTGTMRALWLCVLLLAAVPCLAVELQGLRMWPAPDNTRVVFDVSGPVRYHVFEMDAPDRVVIDLYDTRPLAQLPQPPAASAQLRRVRAARRNGDDYRVVLDVAGTVQVRASLLEPSGRYGHRLVIDLVDPERRRAATTAPPGPDPAREPDALRPVVIAIDPGHGGEDPGAIGRHGAREKDIVLALARKLAKRIDREPGMRAVLVRDGDYYVDLRRRMEIARARRADLFVSIHADAFRDPRVHGSSVYVLSRSGASSEAARWLAERENAADLVGGVTLQDKDEVLRSVLLDLSQTAALQASIDVAGELLRELGGLGKVHRRTVQHAGFAVLKSPDVPSLLVETAFISNPDEEKRLRDARHQDAIAAALHAGIRNYFRDNPPPGTLLAAREHRISRGETLSGIAHRYRVSTEALRMANGLPGDHVRAGEILLIP